MKKIVFCLFGALLAAGCSTVHSNANSKFHSSTISNGSVVAGIPQYDSYGRPYKYVLKYGHSGTVLGPVKHNAYGPGVHMDATGKPVKAVPWP